MTFADTQTIHPDPNRPFKPDDDSQYRNSQFVKNFAELGTPEPVPSSRNGVYPVMKLLRRDRQRRRCRHQGEQENPPFTRSGIPGCRCSRNTQRSKASPS